MSGSEITERTTPTANIVIVTARPAMPNSAGDNQRAITTIPRKFVSDDNA
jgi:hypothetical protein